MEVTETFPRRRPKRNASENEEVRSARLDPAKARERTFQRAVKLLAAKARSVAEIRERLLSGPGTTRAIVESVIARLSEYGYLDDARFAQGYASLRLRERPIGRRRLERDLRLRKVDEAVVDQTLDEVFAETPEAEVIDRAIAKRVRLRGRPKTRVEAKSLFDHLLRQGFAFELVANKVRAATKVDLDEPGD
jgi:regulatory protein